MLVSRSFAVVIVFWADTSVPPLQSGWHFSRTCHSERTNGRRPKGLKSMWRISYFAIFLRSLVAALCRDDRFAIRLNLYRTHVIITEQERTSVLSCSVIMYNIKVSLVRSLFVTSRSQTMSARLRPITVRFTNAQPQTVLPFRFRFQVSPCKSTQLLIKPIDIFCFNSKSQMTHS